MRIIATAGTCAAWKQTTAHLTIGADRALLILDALAKGSSGKLVRSAHIGVELAGILRDRRIH